MEWAKFLDRGEIRKHLKIKKPIKGMIAAIILILNPDMMSLNAGMINGDARNVSSAIFPEERLEGRDRYETAVKISQAGWKNSVYAVIAGGDHFADALCSGPLAVKFKAPVLLCQEKDIPEVTLDELKRLKTKRVFLIGGPKAIAPAAEQQLYNIGIKEIERVGGLDRFETALKIAEKILPGKRNPQEIVLASGSAPWEALAIEPVAARRGMPILLTQGNKLPSAVRRFLENNKPETIYQIGGEETLRNELIAGDYHAVWLGGKNENKINACILQTFREEFNYDRIFAVAGGAEGYSDAICAGILAAREVSPLILASGQNSEELCACFEKQLNIASRVTWWAAKAFFFHRFCQN
jgi:putative cell wall-binding protein